MNIRMISVFLMSMFVVPARMYGHEVTGVESNEQVILKKLQEIVEAKARDARDTQIQIQVSTDNKKNSIAWSVASVAGLITVLIAMIKLGAVHRPNGFADFAGETCKLTIGAGVLGALIALVYHPIINFFITTTEAFISDDSKATETIKKDALLEFVRRWPEFKQYAPAPLVQTFDDLYNSYLQQGALLVLTEQDITNLIDKILVECAREHTKKIGDVVA